LEYRLRLRRAHQKTKKRKVINTKVPVDSIGLFIGAGINK